MIKILVVEDEKNLNKLIVKILMQAGYEAIPAFSAEAALEILNKQSVDLIVLDGMLPGMDGFEFAKELREFKMDMPILMVTALSEVSDMTEGFESGADDYMTKPINEKEFILRIGALLRRAKIATDNVLTIGASTLDYNEFSVKWAGERQLLPKKEFLLLFKLLSYPDKIFTRRQLVDDIWSLESETDERTVDVHVNRIRDRIKENQDFEIQTVRGLGYRAVIKKG